MRSLKVEDCNFDNNKIKFVRNKKEVQYTLPSAAMQLIKNASEQRKCGNKNLVDTEFILKRTKGGKCTDHTYDKDKRVLSQRIPYRIAKICESEKDIAKLDTAILHKSGMLSYFSLLEAVNGRTPSKIEYCKVCKRFGVSPKNWHTYKSKYEHLKKHSFTETYDITNLSPELKTIIYEINSEDIDIQDINDNEDIDDTAKKKPLKPPERKPNDKKPWEENAKNGAIGERIILQHLKEKNFEVVLAKDWCGYDIYAKKKMQ